jgi:Phospholipase_D-nuclease N-terminal
MSGVIRLYGLMFLVDLALMVIALIDCLSTDEYAVRNLPKVVWVLLILLFSPVGPIVWFVAGRPQAQPVGRAGAWKPGKGFPEYERPRPLAPDDDPEFLRKWEADLRRREEELRRKEREEP